jgi:t-SNARE complex subunit (syntaxin)
MIIYIYIYIYYMEKNENKNLIELRRKEFSKVHSIELDEEYKNDLGGLLSEIKEIQELNSQMNNLIISQNENIKNIDKDIHKTTNNIDSSNENLISAAEQQKSIFWKKSMLLTVCTVVVTAPVSVLVGTKIAIIAGVGTAVATGVTLFS